MDSHCLWLTNSLWPIAGRRRRHTEDSPLIGGELSIPPDEGETDEPRRATFSIAGGGDDGGGGAVDNAAAIGPSLNGKASMCLLRLLPASMGHRGRAPPRDPLPRLGIRAYRPQTNGKACASSAPCSQDGPMVRSTATATSAPPPLTAGSGTTTVSADTQPQPQALDRSC